MEHAWPQITAWGTERYKETHRTSSPVSRSELFLLKYASLSLSRKWNVGPCFLAIARGNVKSKDFLFQEKKNLVSHVPTIILMTLF